MKTSIKQLVRRKKLPGWMVKNPVFKSFKQVSKVFPTIGLPNCSEHCEFDLSKDTSLSEKLVYAINRNIHATYLRSREFGDGNLSATFKKVHDSFMLKNNNGLYSVINTDGEKIKINLTTDIIVSNKKVFRKNESVFKVYNKLQELIDAKENNSYNLERLDNIGEFKEFSSQNLPNNKISIVFSSEGIDGLWDIATMSMRGISSCQKWSGQHKQRLIGSIVDPYTGIIYLTSGALNAYGTKMIRRSIVRFVINSDTKKPYILIDKMYPSYDETVFDKFKSFILNKVENKFEVIYGPHISAQRLEGSYIPAHSDFKKLTPKTLSYRDTNISFGRKTKQPILTQNMSVKESNLITKIKQDVSIMQYSDNCHDLVKSMVKGPDFKYMLTDNYVPNIINKAMVECKKKYKDYTFTSSNDYIIKLCYSFLINSKKIEVSQNRRLVKHIKAYFNSTLETKHITPTLKIVYKQIGKTIKQEAKLALEKI